MGRCKQKSCTCKLRTQLQNGIMKIGIGGEMLYVNYSHLRKGVV